ncbi:MAG TPA: hypothetical protein VNO55_21515 [Polyangia bacterium]|nr:hypothetical protein [Polyangia bacterium]
MNQVSSGSVDRASTALTHLVAGVAVAALLCLGVTPAVAVAAQRCPAPAAASSSSSSSSVSSPLWASTALEGIDPEQRLAWIDAHLSKTARRARLWTWGWGAGLVAATVANAVPLAFVSADQRIDWYVGAGTTVIGIVPLLIAPLDVIADARVLHQRVAARVPRDDGRGDAGEDVCRLLADAETRLLRDATNQADGQRWWLHVGNVVLNTGVGLFLGLGYHHWGAGALNAISGSVIGEAIILTQPTGSIDDLNAYRSGALAGGLVGAPGPVSRQLAYRVAF